MKVFLSDIHLDIVLNTNFYDGETNIFSSRNKSVKVRSSE